MQNRAIIPLLFRVLRRGGLSVLAAALILWLPASAGAQALRNPVRIALAHDGNLFVSDFTRQGIVTLDKTTLEPLEFLPMTARPLGVASWKNWLFVGNPSTGSVDVYNPARQYKYSLGGGAGAAPGASDIAIDEGRDLVFVVSINVIKVFHTKGDLLYTFPEGGPNEDLLAGPTAIAIDTVNQEVFVSDYGNPRVGYPPPRIQIFSYAGALVGQIQGQFSRPQGLGVHGGKVYMVDAVLGQIMVFDRATRMQVGTIGKFGTNPGELFAPGDLVIDEEAGDIFATSLNPARVEAFRGGLLP